MTENLDGAGGMTFNKCPPLNVNQGSWAARPPILILMRFLSVCVERGRKYSTVASGSDHIIVHCAIWGMFTDKIRPSAWMILEFSTLVLYIYGSYSNGYIHLKHM